MLSQEVALVIMVKSLIPRGFWPGPGVETVGNWLGWRSGEEATGRAECRLPSACQSTAHWDGGVGSGGRSSLVCSNKILEGILIAN